jgi:hypothetical protein
MHAWAGSIPYVSRVWLAGTMDDHSHSEALEKKKRLRVMVIKEIVQTEEDFIRKIEMLCNVSYALIPCLASRSSSSDRSSKTGMFQQLAFALPAKMARGRVSTKWLIDPLYAWTPGH